MLLVYSVADTNSFNQMKSILETVQQVCPHSKKILVATQMDVEKTRHEVTSDEGKEWARKHKIEFAEVSAKTQQGFDQLKKQIMQVVEIAPKREPPMCD